MSRADAIRDGVEIVEDGRWGCYYKIPCAQCGNTYGSRQYTGNRIYLCPTCREINKKKRKAAVEGYERAVEICRKATFKYGSTPEAMLAIELVKNKYKIIPQQKIGSYHVDFALPDEKLIIEVDGSIYHANTQKELEREAAINYRIGFDWHFIHIPAESISKDVRKVVRLLKKRDTGDKYSF